MKKSLLTSVFLLSLLVGCSTTQQNPRVNLKNIRESRRAVVEVISNDQIKGTGAFISESGLVLTASHLFVNDTVKVQIIGANNKKYSAKLLRRNRVADLALVQIEAEVGETFPHYRLAKRMPNSGESVFLYGAALWNPIMLITGQMANPDNNYCEYPSSNGYLQAAFVNASTPGLVSGGPWINLDGEIFGVQTGHLVDKGHDAGICLVGQLLNIEKLLASKGSVHTAGIQAWVWPLWTADKSLIDQFPKGTSGLVVNSFFHKSTLEKAGIKQHELILACDEKPTLRRADLFSIIHTFKPGDVVAFKVMAKDHKVRTVKVKLADLENGTL